VAVVVFLWGARGAIAAFVTWTAVVSAVFVMLDGGEKVTGEAKPGLARARIHL
jgi:hypothetical protein